MDQTICNSALGTARLQRFTADPTQSLQAWDAADLNICQYLADHVELDKIKNVLVCNDEFGALSTILAMSAPNSYQIVSVNDAYIGQRATLLNLRNNGQRDDAIQLHSGIPAHTPEPCLIIYKIPKSTALLINQLHQLRPLLSTETLLLGGVMARHLTKRIRSAFSNIIGPTTFSLAKRKARTLVCNYQINLNVPENPYPSTIEVNGFAGGVLQHAGVFSQHRLDPGTALLLQHFPSIQPNAHIIDLGCGSGVLGLRALLAQVDCRVTFIDDSYVAITSAQSNCDTHFPNSRSVFLHHDSLSAQNLPTADLILCNPPFHSGRAIVTSTAESMFKQSTTVLRKGGRIYVVGNRHLQYSKRLHRLFGHHQVVAQNAQFQVIFAQKR